MRIALLGFLMVLFGCSSTNKILSAQQISTLKDVVEAKEIEIEFNWAQPTGLISSVSGLQNLIPFGSTINNINLNGNPNFFKINKDSLSIDLPYFGSQQLPKGYNNTEIGVNFNGTPEKFEEKFDAKRNKYILTYWLKGTDESYKVILVLFPNNSSVLYVNSSHRTPINYDGEWKRIPKK